MLPTVATARRPAPTPRRRRVRGDESPSGHSHRTMSSRPAERTIPAYPSQRRGPSTAPATSLWLSSGAVPRRGSGRRPRSGTTRSRDGCRPSSPATPRHTCLGPGRVVAGPGASRTCLDGEHLTLVDAFVVVVVDVSCAVRGRHGLGEPQRHRRRSRGDDRAGRRVRGPEARVGAGRAGRDEDDGKGQEGDERSAPTSSRAPSEAPARAGPAQRHAPRVGRELLRPGEIGAGRGPKAVAVVGGGGPQGRSKVALRRWPSEQPAPEPS